MQLGKEARVEAVTLCTMLLPLANRHTLVYLMDVSKVKIIVCGHAINK